MAVRLVRVHPNGFGDRVLRAIIDQSFAIAIPHRRTAADGIVTHPALEESARVILTFAEALSLHEKLLMTDSNPLLELYEQGISAHKLRLSYAEDTPDGFLCPPSTRQELMELAEEDFVWASNFHKRVLEILDSVESKVIAELLSGSIVALGYDDPHDPTIRSVPPHQWNFLKLDFDECIARWEDIYYHGLRLVHRRDLTDQQLSALQRQQPYRKAGQPAKDENIVSFDLQAKDWAEVGFRFLKDSLVAVRIQNKEQHITLGALGLINNTTGAPNIACVILLKLANGQRVSSEEKHVVSSLRRQLKQKFGLPSDPFHYEEGRGYVPHFKLIDNRNALDQRAKEKAIHQIFNDEQQADKQGSDGDHQGGYSYEEDWEMRDDKASEWLEEGR